MTGLAELLKADLATVKGTLETYIKAASGEAADPFGKMVFPVNYSLDETFRTLHQPAVLRAVWRQESVAYLSPFNRFPSIDLLADVCTITPAIHYCMGGARINASAQILTETPHEHKVPLPTFPTEFLKPMQGLFGAGEVTGGLHGANRLGGRSRHLPRLCDARGGDLRLAERTDEMRYCCTRQLAAGMRGVWPHRGPLERVQPPDGPSRCVQFRAPN